MFYHGQVSDVPKFLSEAAVFVCPSIMEGGPLTVLEAASIGVPSIVTEQCGVKDFVVASGGGIVVPASDHTKLAAALNWCYANQDQLCSRGEQAKKALAAYSFYDFIFRLTQVIGVV